MIPYAKRRYGHEKLFTHALAYLGFVLLLTGVVTGCTGRKFAELRPGLEAHGSYIEGVPFYKQPNGRLKDAVLGIEVA
jgi:hypothetical protein